MLALASCPFGMHSYNDKMFHLESHLCRRNADHDIESYTNSDASTSANSHADTDARSNTSGHCGTWGEQSYQKLPRPAVMSHLMLHIRYCSSHWCRRLVAYTFLAMSAVVRSRCWPHIR